MAISIRSVTTEAGSGSTISVTTPSSPAAQVGDLLLVILSNDYYDLAGLQLNSVTPSASTTAIAGATVDYSDAHIKAWWAVVGTAGAVTVVGETGHSDEEKGLAVYVISGADTTSPVDDSIGDNYTSNASIVTSSMTATGADDLLVIHVQTAGQGTTTNTWPGGMTPQYDDTDGTFMSMIGATQQLSASGATGTRTITRDRNDVLWGASSILIKTASAGGDNGATTAWLRA